MTSAQRRHWRAWARDYAGKLLERAADTCELDALTDEQDDVVRERMAEIAEDLRELRPVRP